MILFLPHLIKVAGVVILNKAYYLSKMDAILGETGKFLKLGDLTFHDTHKIEKKLQKCFHELFKSKLISNEIYEFIRPVGWQRPRMYGLPKFINPVFLCGLYFICAILVSILWLNGL